MSAGTWSSREGDWSNHASCLDKDPELFFPVGETGRAILQMQEARIVCAGCPVQTACLTFALKTNVQYGVWGGTGPQERARLKRRIEIVGTKTRVVVSDKVVRVPAN